MRHLALCLSLVLLLLPSLALAQGPAPWEVFLYTETGEQGSKSGEIVVLTPNGVIDRYPVPASLYASAPYGLSSVAVSPDRQYAAFGTSSGGGVDAPPVAIMNLQTGACCSFVTAPLPDVDAYVLGSFSPDSSRLAIAYVGFHNRETYDVEGGLLVADPATGMVTDAITVPQIKERIGGFDYDVFAQPGPWTGAGIHFVLSCYACEGTFESPWNLWNPAAGLVATATDEHFSIFADTLAQTGEMIYTAYNPNFPMGDQLGMFLPANVVEYYESGVPITREQREAGVEAPVAYFNPENLNLGLARWILDGRAFVIPASEGFPQGTVVYRDGTSTVVPYAILDAFLAGTPDGFLTHDQTNTVNYYQFAGNTWNIIPLEQLYDLVRVVRAPALGATVTQPFAIIQAGAQGIIEEPPLAPQQEGLSPLVTCPGFLESRLSPGGIGRVTPGSANRLREQPSTSAPILGLIPGGAAFAVISGPQCDPAGIAWWEVDYGGIRGWTAEGQGNAYFVEPAS